MKKVSIITANWHSEIVDIAKDVIVTELSSSEIETDVKQVPGSLEFPLFAKRAAAVSDCVICCGFIVDGGIYRHEFVASSVLNGIVNVSLETDTPILSVVLTPQKFDENNFEDIAYFKDHMKIKGKEAADAAKAVLDL